MSKFLQNFNKLNVKEFLNNELFKIPLPSYNINVKGYISDYITVYSYAIKKNL